LIAATLNERNLEVLFLIKGENQDEHDKWLVHHGIALQPEDSSNGRVYRRVGSVSRAEGITVMLAEEEEQHVRII
jgi:hypothetical protein